ncbi:MAG: DUF1211 domain-containing protein [Thermoplasmata archaeon]|nr:DUF1211 domain-containing protein [Thermoplasmata archaeon]
MAGDEGHPPDTGTGFRPSRGIAGEDLNRILALSDGVFAFALTLLVLSLVVPVFPNLPPGVSPTNAQLAGALNADWARFLGYGFAFVMIAIWWVVHHRTFQYIARYDSALVWINMILLIQIAVMPFVLSVYSTYSNLQVAVDLFAGIQVTLGLTATLLWDYARRAKLLKPNVPAPVARYFTRRGYLISLVFAASIVVSFHSVAWAQYTWVFAFVVQRFLTVTPD